MIPYGKTEKLEDIKIVDLERDAALSTFDGPNTIFNLMWAPFFERVLKSGFVSSAALKGFCLYVVEHELRNREGV